MIHFSIFEANDEVPFDIGGDPEDLIENNEQHLRIGEFDRFYLRFDGHHRQWYTINGDTGEVHGNGFKK